MIIGIDGTSEAAADPPRRLLRTGSVIGTEDTRVPEVHTDQEITVDREANRLNRRQSPTSPQLPETKVKQHWLVRKLCGGKNDLGAENVGAQER